MFSRRMLLMTSAATFTYALSGCSDKKDPQSKISKSFNVSDVEGRASARIEKLKTSSKMAVQKPIEGFNHVLGAGQSLSSGFEAHPPLTLQPIATNVFSLGDAVQTSSRKEWQPHTSISGTPTKLQPLIARTLSEDSDVLLSQKDAADLEFRDFSLAEAPIISNVYSYAKRSSFSADKVTFIATESARGGSTLSTIIRAQDGRIGNATKLVADEAATQGKKTCLLWVNFVHGQTDERDATDASLYETQMGEHLDAADAFARRDYGQQQPALKMITQATSVAVIDDNVTPIAQAQLNFVRNRNDSVIVAPDFCVPNKTVHLTANGSRMLGEYSSKVADIVLNQGQGWVPTQLFKVWSDPKDPNILFATFLTWKPPIRFEKYFNRNQLEMRSDKGIKISDALGDVELARSPEIVGPLTVKVYLSRPIEHDARFALCSQKTDGANNICDSDTAVGIFNYEFIEGMDEVENIRELVGKPYNLPNFALAEDVPIPYDLDS